MRWIYTKSHESVYETKFEQIYNEGFKIGKQFKPSELKSTINKLTLNNPSNQERIQMLLQFSNLASIKLPDLLLLTFESKSKEEVNDAIIVFIAGLHNGSLENK